MIYKLLVLLLLPGTCCLLCDDLLMGQFFCEQPEIEKETQAEKFCHANKTTKIKCFPVPNIDCDGELLENKTVFYKEIPCRYVNGKSFKTALLLSIFLGVFGIDRFYLGYPAIGVFKLCTLGFFMIFQFIDVVLIATQALKPADGSDYYVDYFDHQMTHIKRNNETYRLLP